jgi:hypothetical protein
LLLAWLTLNPEDGGSILYLPLDYTVSHLK